MKSTQKKEAVQKTRKCLLVGTWNPLLEFFNKSEINTAKEAVQKTRKCLLVGTGNPLL